MDTRILLLTLVLACASVSGCGLGWQLWYGGKCFSTLSSIRTSKFSDVSTQCASKFGSQLVSVHSAEENEWLRNGLRNGQLYSYYFFLGLQCDGKQYTWSDGTPYDYNNFTKDTQCDATTKGYIFSIYSGDGSWSGSTTVDAYPVCESLELSSSPCDQYTAVGDADNTCTLYCPQTSDWDDAEDDCVAREGHLAAVHNQETNDFVRRTAIANGGSAGTHIGLHLAPGSSEYTWTDGTSLDYKNFASGFPNAKYGNCTAMQTAFTPGEWMNEDCVAQKLPYTCSKPAFNTSAMAPPRGCPDDINYYDGDDIYSPGYPLPGTVPQDCDYILNGKDDATKLTIQVFLLEANMCCDHLTLFDGLFSSVAFSNLTGYQTGVTIFSKTNTVRMHWNATSALNVRGFHIRFTSSN